MSSRSVWFEQMQCLLLASRAVCIRGCSSVRLRAARVVVGCDHAGVPSPLPIPSAPPPPSASAHPSLRCATSHPLRCATSLALRHSSLCLSTWPDRRMVHAGDMNTLRCTRRLRGRSMLRFLNQLSRETFRRPENRCRRPKLGRDHVAWMSHFPSSASASA